MTIIQSGNVSFDSPGFPIIVGGNPINFTRVIFSTPFPVGSNVIVIPMVQTFNGADTPALRIAEVTTTGFLIRMNELVGSGSQPFSDGNHVQETIGWVAFSI